MKIAVIGAGISGLSTAHFLKKNGVDVQIFEKNDYPGGTIRSKIVYGYLVEDGPNSTSETNLIIDELLSDLNISEEKVYADENSKYRFILRNGKLHALPSGIGSFLSTKLWTIGREIKTCSASHSSAARIKKNRLRILSLDASERNFWITPSTPLSPACMLAIHRN